MSARRSTQDQSVRADRSVTLRLEGFARETLEEEAAREGLPIEELIMFSVLYYLADLDSGRVSRRISTSPYPRRSGDCSSGGADRRSAARSARRITGPSRRLSRMVVESRPSPEPPHDPSTPP